jgi:hypothetical protein
MHFMEAKAAYVSGNRHNYIIEQHTENLPVFPLNGTDCATRSFIVGVAHRRRP